MLKNYGRLSMRTMRAQRMLPMKDIMFLLISLIALNNLMMRMPNLCYSRLNILVNEINYLDVKQIEDTELVRKILHSLRRPDYDLLTTIIYEKELNTLKPNQILNKVIAHELRNDIKPRAPPSSPKHSALACKQVKKLKEMTIKGSSSEEEEEEERSTSNDEKEPMNPDLCKQVKKINKCLKKINSMGYMIFLKNGPHHQHMKVERRFKKKL